VKRALSFGRGPSHTAAAQLARKLEAYGKAYLSRPEQYVRDSLVKGVMELLDNDPAANGLKETGKLALWMSTLRRLREHPS
jgi:hypothetical protein